MYNRLLNLCTLFGCCRDTKPQILREKLRMTEAHIFDSNYIYTILFFIEICKCDLKTPLYPVFYLRGIIGKLSRPALKPFQQFIPWVYMGFHPGISAVKA
jgi:hypothetical protein